MPCSFFVRSRRRVSTRAALELRRSSRVSVRPHPSFRMEGRLERVRTGLGSGTSREDRRRGAQLGTGSAAGRGTGTDEAAGGVGSSGAFNERDKQADKNAELSHLLFSTFGLDHFPRYLSRWSLDEVESLETQLTGQLELVRQQKAAMLAAAADNAPYRREFVREDGLDLDSVLAPECAQIIRRGGIAKNRAAFLRLREWQSRATLA